MAASRRNRRANCGPINPTNFAKLAEDMGALGIRVERAADFAPALHKALAANRPAVIDVVTDIEALAPVAVT